MVAVTCVLKSKQLFWLVIVVMNSGKLSYGVARYVLSQIFTFSMINIVFFGIKCAVI